MNNSFGNNFRIDIYGGSHTESLGVVITGVPAGIALAESDFEADLSRRRSGAKGTTPRREGDVPHIVAGVANGVTTGEKVEIVFYNENRRSGDYERLKNHPRPSHADLTARHKYGEQFDLRGGGIFSGSDLKLEIHITFDDILKTHGLRPAAGYSKHIHTKSILQTGLFI